MKKRSQALKIVDHLRDYGVITTRIAAVTLRINQPFGRISDVKKLLPLQETWVRKDKVRFKVFYTLGSKLREFLEYNGLVAE